MLKRILWSTTALFALGMLSPQAQAYCSSGPNYNSCMAEERAEQARERAQEQARERAQEQARERAQEQARERAEEQARERAQEQARERAEEQARQRAEEQARERAAQQAQERAAQQAQERAAQQAQERAAQQAQQRAAQQAQEHAAQQAQQKAAQQAQEHAAQQAQQKAAQQTQERAAAQQAQQRAAEQAQERLREQQRPPAVPANNAGPARPLPAATPAAAPRPNVPEPRAGAQPVTNRPAPPQQPAAVSRPAATTNAQPVAQTRPSTVQKPIGAPIKDAHPITVNPSTTVASAPEHHIAVIKHTANDGSKVVVATRSSATGLRPTASYREKQDTAQGITTRIYTNGQKTVVGKGFVSRSAPGRATVVTHQNGLKEATGPNGRLVYREAIGTAAGRDGRQHNVITRTVYTKVEKGKAMSLSAPVVQTYHAVPVQGATVYAYQPAVIDPALLVALTAMFPQALTPPCDVCALLQSVAFAQNPAYANLMDLLSDLQMSTAIDDGSDYAMDDQSDDQADGQDVDQLNVEVADLQQQVNDAAVENADLRSQIGDQQQQIEDLHALLDDNSMPMTTSRARSQIQIPEEVRQQIHREVAQSIALEKQQSPLSLADIVNSPDAPSYIFQVGDSIDAVDESTGEQCVLSAGDMALFDRLPSAGDQSADMRIVTSKRGECAPKAVVQVGLSDLQDMLNTFSQRLENNMTKIRAQVASSAN